MGEATRFCDIECTKGQGLQVLNMLSLIIQGLLIVAMITFFVSGWRWYKDVDTKKKDRYRMVELNIMMIMIMGILAVNL